MKSDIVDLRSDTVTRPSPGMRAAIAAAEVGDDVLGDDPTVLRLQERVARLLGKEAALFVPSGSMANLVAIRGWTQPGDEIIADVTVHSYNYESAGPAAIAGCSFRLLNGPRGIYSAADVEAAIRPPESHFPRTRLVIIENTTNRGGGSIWPVETVAEVGATAHRHGLILHIDGARLLNACVARKLDPVEYTRHADSVSICFSKGLSAPIGSIVAGPKDFIARAHRVRKMLGGGMRQVGILAAAAEYALDHNVERLAEDHAHARRLAEAISVLPGIRLNPRDVETNIVLFEIEDSLGSAAEFVARMRDEGVWMFATGPRQVRALTHLDVSAAQIERAIAVFQQVCRRAC